MEIMGVFVKFCLGKTFFLKYSRWSQPLIQHYLSKHIFLRFQFLVDDAVVHKVLYVLVMYHKEDFSEMVMWQVKLW